MKTTIFVASTVDGAALRAMNVLHDRGHRTMVRKQGETDEQLAEREPEAELIVLQPLKPEPMPAWSTGPF